MGYLVLPSLNKGIIIIIIIIIIFEEFSNMAVHKFITSQTKGEWL